MAVLITTYSKSQWGQTDFEFKSIQSILKNKYKSKDWCALICTKCSSVSLLVLWLINVHQTLSQHLVKDLQVYYQWRTKWRNCRLTPKTPDYQLGWAVWAVIRLLNILRRNFYLFLFSQPTLLHNTKKVHIIKSQSGFPPLRSSLFTTVIFCRLFFANCKRHKITKTVTHVLAKDPTCEMLTA